MSARSAALPVLLVVPKCVCRHDCNGESAVTLAVVSSKVVMAPSFAARRRRYVPDALKVTAVSMDDGLAKATPAGPLTACQSGVIVAGVGLPSSVTVALIFH